MRHFVKIRKIRILHGATQSTAGSACTPLQECGIGLA